MNFFFVTADRKQTKRKSEENLQNETAKKMKTSPSLDEEEPMEVDEVEPKKKSPKKKQTPKRNQTAKSKNVSMKNFFSKFEGMDFVLINFFLN